MHFKIKGNKPGPSGLQGSTRRSEMEILELSLTLENRPLTPPLKSPQMSAQTSKLLTIRTSRKLKLRDKIHSLQSQVAILKRKVTAHKSKSSLSSVVETVTLQDFKNLCDTFLPSKCAEFVKLQADLHKKDPKQRRTIKNSCTLV